MSIAVFLNLKVRVVYHTPDPPVRLVRQGTGRISRACIGRYFFAALKEPSYGLGFGASGLLSFLWDAEDRAMLETRLKQHVTKLSGEIGVREILHHRAAYEEAVAFISEKFESVGFSVKLQKFAAMGEPCTNVIGVVKGSIRTLPPLVVGAHFDTADDTPGANDNGSGVAALLEIAREMNKPCRTLILAAFTNEEPPFFGTRSMGSWKLANWLIEKKTEILGMVCLETIGFYSSRPGTEHVPQEFASLARAHDNTEQRGDFIGFFGNQPSSAFLDRFTEAFQVSSEFPCVGVASSSPMLAMSDQISFWKAGFPAIMITDTAPLRYQYYHSAEDTSDKLTYPQFAEAVGGLIKTIGIMCGET